MNRSIFQRLPLVVGLLFVVLSLGCSSAGWRHFLEGAHAVLGVGARLAPLACRLAVLPKVSEADCAKLEAVARATEEARKALEVLGERCGEAAGCDEAARLKERAAELRAELEVIEGKAAKP